jgi:hypothetical protein
LLNWGKLTKSANNDNSESMKELPDLKQLTDEEKDALILKLWEELQKLQQAQKKKPKKTSKNSSQPPAQGFKAEVKSREKGIEEKRSGSLGREGGGRQLSANPDQIIRATHPFGGSAHHCNEPVVKGLDSIGLVTVI